MEKTKGIFLTAFGKRGYIFSAYNFAFSIKYYNKDLSVALFCDNSVHEQLSEEQKKVFDIIIPIPDEIRFQNGRTNAAGIKTSVYDFLPFDENLYLDVDALALQDLTPIFADLEKLGGYYYTHVVGEWNISQGREIPHMIWAYADDIWNQYGLAQDALLPSTNSSIQYIKKCDESKALFERIKENLSNPIPVDKLRTPWGGGQPDELYLNISLAQLGINAKTEKQYLFLGSGLDKRTLSQLQEDYKILSLFGHKTMTRPRYTQWYDNLLIQYFRKEGKNHLFKHHLIMNDKHANTRASLPERLRAPQPIERVVQEAPKSQYKILLKFPTRSRPEKFLTCLSKAFEMAADKENLKALVSYDSDDKTMTDEVIEKAKAIGNVTCISGTSKNKIDAVNRDMDKSGEWDILILLSDDMECEQQGWDNIIRAKFEGKLDRILHFNDGYRKIDLLTLPVMGRPYYERFNYIYHPDYISLWCDNEQMEVARKLVRYRYFPTVLFRHKMAMNGFAQDELHKHTESFFNQDQKTFNARRAKGFPLKSVLELQAA